MTSVTPALIFILGALLVPFLKGRVKHAYILLIPVVGFFNLINLPEGALVTIEFLGYELVPLKVDRLSLVFGYIFHIAAFLMLLYALSEKNDIELTAGLLYSGSALGVAFAGDLLTLFIFWEIMTIASLALIWARRTERSTKAGFRYALVHVLGGVILLFGIVMYVHEQGTAELGYIGLDGLSTYLIFIGLGVNCAWPGLHAWLTDAYPEAGIAGSVFLSAFTTKAAVYVLARTYPGTEALIYIGAVMTVFPIFFAVIENDLRRVLSYSLINQVGFMVVGIGIGTELALNGVAAHAFAHILYKALLFMSMGAVLRQTGRINATDLGGLYKTMPLTCIFYLVGAASMSAPLFSGFVSKSMIISALAIAGYPVVWFALFFASAGVFLQAGIKVPFFAFFSHDSGIRVEEPPPNMQVSMGITAFLCVYIGIFPGMLYSILPYPVDYVPYTAPHVIAQLQLLVYSALAFTLLMLSGTYPAELRAINLDLDMFYRKGAWLFVWFVHKPMAAFGDYVSGLFRKFVLGFLVWFFKNPSAAINIILDYMRLFISRPKRMAELMRRIEKERYLYPGDATRHWPIGFTVAGITAFLLVFLLLHYL